MLHKTKKSRSTIPGYTLIPDGDHYKIRKIGNSGERVKSDPAYHLTRLNNEAFKKAAGLGKLIRASLLFGTKIKSKPATLTAALLKVLATSNTALHARTFGTANFESMNNFNLNDEANWKDCMNLNPEIIYVPYYRRVTVFLPGFIPSEISKVPEGVTHVRITTNVIFVNSAGCTMESHNEQTTILPLKGMAVRPSTLIAKCESLEKDVWLVAMSVTWYQPQKNATQLTVSKTHGPLILVKMGSV
jgi:hypothetical protein